MSNYERYKTMTLTEIANELNDNGQYPPKPDERYPIFPVVLLRASRAGGYIRTCFNCKRMPYHYPADKAYAPGHCYSDAGREEANISGTCEWCFDHIMQDPEDQEPEEERVDSPADYLFDVDEDSSLL